MIAGGILKRMLPIRNFIFKPERGRHSLCGKGSQLRRVRTGMNNPMETNYREVNMSVQVADHRNANAVKWLSYIVIVVAGLATISVVLEPVVRYSYVKNDTFGLGVRTDLNQADLTANAVLLKPAAENAVSEELKCLAQNIYFEARSEPVEGKLAVAHVVMNRVTSPRFPNTVCGVVHQGGYAVRHRCQFSWWCDGKSETITNHRAWLESLELAHRAYRDRSDDPTGNALWYHAAYVSPSWRSDFVEGPKIGRHIFYSERTSVASMVEVVSNQSIN